MPRGLRARCTLFIHFILHTGRQVLRKRARLCPRCARYLVYEDTPERLSPGWSDDKIQHITETIRQMDPSLDESTICRSAEDALAALAHISYVSCHGCGVRWDARDYNSEMATLGEGYRSAVAYRERTLKVSSVAARMLVILGSTALLIMLIAGLNIPGHWHDGAVRSLQGLGVMALSALLFWVSTTSMWRAQRGMGPAVTVVFFLCGISMFLKGLVLMLFGH